jgi:hypothetical protein
MGGKDRIQIFFSFFFNFLQFFLKKNEKKQKHSLKNWGQKIVWRKKSLLERGVGQHICSADGRKGGRAGGRAGQHICSVDGRKGGLSEYCCRSAAPLSKREFFSHTIFFFKLFCWL